MQPSPEESRSQWIKCQCADSWLHSTSNCVPSEGTTGKEGIQCHMALGHEEFPLGMVHCLEQGAASVVKWVNAKKRVGSLCNSYISIYIYIYIILVMFLKAPKSGGSQPRPALSEYSEYFVVLFGAPEPGEAQVFLGTPPEASVDRLDRSTGSGLKPGQWFFQWFLKGSHLHGKEISRPRHQASAVCWFSWEENPTTTQLLILYVCLSAAALAASGFSIAWFRAMFSLPTQCLRTSPSILGTMTYASLRFHLAAHLMGLLNPKQCVFLVAQC